MPSVFSQEMVAIKDYNGNMAIVDSFNNCIGVMDWEHIAVHKGFAFSLNVYSTVEAGTPIYCQFKTGAGYIHLKNKILVDGADTMLCSFIESPTITDGTVLVPSYNRNRNSLNVSTMVVYNDPTEISGGATLEYDYLHADDSGNNGNATAVSGGSSSSIEWILKPNTNYIHKLENLGDGVATFLAKLMWYEHI